MIDWVVLLVLVVIWGSAFAAIRIGVETIPAAWLVTGRLITGAAFLAVWMLGERLLRGRDAPPVELPSPKALLWYGGIGVFCTALPFTFYSTAAHSVASGVLAICNGGTPFFTALLAHVFVPGERLTARKTIGVALGFAGLAALVYPEVASGAHAAAGGLLLAIVGAALYAVSNVGTRLAPTVSPAMSSFLIVASGAVAMLVMAPILAPYPAHPSLPSIAGMLYLGLLPTGFAFILYVWLIRQAGSLFTSFTTYLAPLWATALGVTFLHETFELSMALAMGLIFSGVGIAYSARRRTAT